MRTASIDVNVEYLLGFLQDEFSDLEHARIHPVAPSSTQKSLDLPQDYDPEVNDVHLLKGVRLRIDSKEFFFPSSWVSSNQMNLVYELIKEIREMIL